MEYIIRSHQIFTQTGVLDGSIHIGDGIIKRIGDMKQMDETLIDLRKYTVMPGLIDIHIHGGMGYDTMDDSHDSIKELAKYKASEGVTSFCPSTVTSSIGRTMQVIRNVKAATEDRGNGAKIIGAFLEGPYLHTNYRGAHAEEFIREITINELDELIDAYPCVVKSIAIAPDKEGAQKAIEHLIKRGVNVRIGHSGATCAEANEAISRGANIAIHAYNAMSPLNHREPGMVGAVLSNPNIYCELICDFIHVSPTACDIAIKCKGSDKLILVTDCLSSGGLSDGEYRLGELKIIVKDSVARTETGALAGSSLKLIQAVRNVHEVLGVPLSDAIKMASLTPACALGIDDSTGNIKVGKKADIIAIDGDYNVVFVMIDGEICIDKRNN